MAEQRRAIDLDEVRRLMARATGDEKHDESSTSTLDALAVLYERRPSASTRRTPAGPTATGSSSARATGRSRTTRSSRTSASSREAWLDDFMDWGGKLGSHPDRQLVPGVEASTGSLGHGLPMSVGVALALRAAGSTEQRVVVLTGDAELNEGSNWEAILLAPALHLTNLTLLVIDNHSSSLPMGPWRAEARARSAGPRASSTGTTTTPSRRRSPRATSPARPRSSPTSRRASGERPLDARASGGDRRRSARRGSARRARPRRDQHRPVRAGAPCTTRTAPSTSASWSRPWSAWPRGSRWRGSCRSCTRSRRSSSNARWSRSSSTSATRDCRGRSCSVGGSYDYTSEGFTHHSPGDVQVMLTVPGMQVLVPGTPDELERLFRATYANGHTTYLRTEHRDERGAARGRGRPSGGGPAWRRRDGRRGRADARSHARRGRRAWT